MWKRLVLAISAVSLTGLAGCVVVPDNDAHRHDRYYQEHHWDYDHDRWHRDHD
jgi:hypothetical protein